MAEVIVSWKTTNPKGMHFKVLLWSLVLCLGLLAWLKWDLMQSDVYYESHDYLYDHRTGAPLEPRQLINITKIVSLSDEYLSNTNAVQRLHDLVYQTNLENPFPLYQSYSDEQELRMSAWPISNQTECGEQLDWINQQLAEQPEYQLIKGKAGRDLSNLLDSFGKPESGTYSGLVFWAGSYTQCLRTTLDEGAIKTRYCVAKMRPKWWPQEEYVFPESRIRIGACLPESCDTLSFPRHKHKIETLIKFELTNFYKSNLAFDGLYCLPDERSPARRIPLAGRLLLALIGGWLGAILVASVIYRRHCLQKFPTEATYNSAKSTYLQIEQSGSKEAGASKTKQPSEHNGILEALALQTNWQQFTEDKLGRRAEQLNVEGFPQRLDMRSLDLLRALMAISIVLAHTSLLLVLLARHIGNRVQLNMSADGLLVISVGRCVDIFFMISGLLFAYNLIRRLPAERLSSPLVWLGSNLDILIRVGPLYVLTYWFARLIMPYVGHGPWWDYGTFKLSLRGVCKREHWLKSVPYFGQQGQPRLATCVSPAWFLTSYIQLGLIIPLITYVISRAPNQLTRFALLAYMMLISALQLTMKLQRQTTLREDAFTQYGGFLISLLEKFQPTGTMAALGRVNCVAIGCYLGYLLHRYETGALREWPRWLVGRRILAASCIVQLVVFAAPLLGQLFGNLVRSRLDPVEFALGYTMANTLWLSALAIQMIALFTVHNRCWLARFASHRFWHLFSKLGLCICLIHFEVLLVGYTAYEQAPSLGFRTDGWRMFSLAMLITLPLSLFVYLFFEAPITRLLKLMTAHHELTLKYAPEESHQLKDC